MIANTWHCEATLNIHESGWLVYKFQNEVDKLVVLRGGPCFRQAPNLKGDA